MGSWCYVDAKTCTYPSLNDTTGQSYGWCQNNQSTTTYDTGARPALPRKGLCGCSACRLHIRPPSQALRCDKFERVMGT